MKAHQIPLFNLGFRIFFLSAAVYGMVSMAQWLAFYAWAWNSFPLVVPQYAHGREMLLGYAFAVIAGFLLTAVQNWTGVAMPRGSALLRLWLLWLGARLCFITHFLIGSLILDGLFALAVLYYVFRACQLASTPQLRRQAGILSKLALLALLEALLAYAIISQDMVLTRVFLYAVVYVMLGLVITIGRRVLPFFTQNGLKALGIDFAPRNSEALDAWALRAFLIFFVFSFFTADWARYPFALSAFAVAFLNMKRLRGWYHMAIWRLPLLWSLFMAMFIISAGLFLLGLQALTAWFTPSLALHLLILGALGLMIVSMMGRVSLGHTGRNIYQPPRALKIALALMLLCLLFRVVLPLWQAEHYRIWMLHAQVTWLLCFACFVYAYTPILGQNRPDGRAG